MSHMKSLPPSYPPPNQYFITIGCICKFFSPYVCTAFFLNKKDCAFRNSEIIFMKQNDRQQMRFLGQFCSII